ncbi:MAG: PD40 domain-containing protein, partial [Emcibacter sp.]|nr:PD40 domain-containing protein [Emcibacter sp.]
MMNISVMIKFMSLCVVALSMGGVNSWAEAELPLEPTRAVTFESDEGTWMSLDISPDGKAIIFDMLGDLYALDSAGGQARPLTSGMAFDTQPVFSPDGGKIAFVSDKSGAENIWTMAVNGTDLQQVTFQETERALFSPEWSADGKYIYASLFRADLHGHGLWRYKADGSGGGEQIFKIKTAGGPQSVTGATPSADGKYLYYAHLSGGLEFDHVVRWTINRRDLNTGQDIVLVAAPVSRLSDPAGGSYFRPVPSSDGRFLAYGLRYDGKTGLRLRDLKTGEDKWLALSLQQDQLQASHIQDILPRYSFTPDNDALLISVDGKIKRLDIKTSIQKTVPFKVDVSVALGPDLRRDIKLETGPVQARLIQEPEQSPDGKRLVFSALGKIYIMPLKQGAVPSLLGAISLPAYQPSWSADGKSIVYITWTAKAGGQVWSMSSDGSGAAKRLTQETDFYTNPVFGPDGKAVYVLRSSHAARLQNYMEYGPLRQGDLLKLSLDLASAEKIHSGMIGGELHFDAAGEKIYFLTPEGLQSLNLAVMLEAGQQQKEIQVVGPGWYFMEGVAPVDG